MATYPIDPDVRRIAKRFGGRSLALPRLAQAMLQAEGGKTRIVKAVQCSEPTVKTTDDAIEVLCRTAVHALADYVENLDRDGFVEFLGGRWAPVGVENDPTNLNTHWVPNVKKLWRQVIA